MKVGIIGLGLIGGSLGKTLKQESKKYFILGYDRNSSHLKTAKECALIDECCTYENLVASAEVIFIATPTSSIPLICVSILDVIQPHQTLAELGSTKKNVLKAVDQHLNRKQFVSCHPMAGTEFSGPKAAKETLYQTKKWIFCDTEKSEEKALEKINMIIQDLKMEALHMNGKEHDISAAFVSHFSHITSICLALSVLKKEKSEEAIFSLASGGFRSTSRLAKSSAETWIPIFLENKENIIEIMESYQDYFQQFKKSLETSDENSLKNLIQQANKIKQII